MAKKIYLSAAAHAIDNPVKCPQACGENVHCTAYMDVVEKRLTALGFAVKRGFRNQTGDGAMRNRVAEANKWGADLYYVAHTNAGGGRYSMTMCWKDAASKAKAAVFGKYRTWKHGHKVKARTDLYEIKATAMPCLYDELFFHDNAEDCGWFHKGGMAQMAEETVQAMCELLGVAYVPPVQEQPKEESPKESAPADTPADTPVAGDVILLKQGKLYRSSTGNACVTRTGTFYLYDGKKVNGRYRVTNKPTRVGKTPVALNVSGWVAL